MKPYIHTYSASQNRYAPLYVEGRKFICIGNGSDIEPISVTLAIPREEIYYYDDIYSKLVTSGWVGVNPTSVYYVLESYWETMDAWKKQYVEKYYPR